MTYHLCIYQKQSSRILIDILYTKVIDMYDPVYYLYLPTCFEVARYEYILVCTIITCLYLEWLYNSITHLLVGRSITMFFVLKSILSKVFSIIFLSFQRLFCCDSGWLYRFLHIGVGGVCLLIVMAAVFLFEHSLVSFIKEQWKQRWHKKTE